MSDDFQDLMELVEDRRGVEGRRGSFVNHDEDGGVKARFVKFWYDGRLMNGFISLGREISSRFQIRVQNLETEQSLS